MADVSSMISYKQTHLSEQSDTHAVYTMDIVDIHLHATVWLYILFWRILFQKISPKLISGDIKKRGICSRSTRTLRRATNASAHKALVKWFYWKSVTVKRGWMA